MEKGNNEELENELGHQKEWCLTILNFIFEKYNNTIPFLSQMKEAVIETYNNRSIRGMKYCYNDINEWAKGLPISDMQELDVLLKSKFGEGFQKQDKKDKAKINSIIRIGRIANEDEYRLILNYIEQISTNKSKRKEVDLLNRLLVAFHR